MRESSYIQECRGYQVVGRTFGINGWYKAPDNTRKWFEGCERANVLVFHGISADSMLQYALFESLTGAYPKQVPIKGGFTGLNPEVIVFYSFIQISDWCQSPVSVLMVIGRAQDVPVVDRKYISIEECWPPLDESRVLKEDDDEHVRRDGTSQTCHF